MTVAYTHKLGTASIVGFNGLMFRLRGSVYKIIWPEFLIWTSLYAILSFTYRILLNEDWRHRFALFSIECQKSTELVPLTFILGFYVNLVVVRWSSMIETMPYVDGISMLIATLIRPKSQTPEGIETCRMHRRTLARYLTAFHVVTLRDCCIGIFKRFPTMDHIVKGGLLTQDEADKYEANKEKLGGGPYFTIPKWLFAHIGLLRINKFAVGDHLHQHIQDMANLFRSRTMWLTCFDWIPIPLAYTQVVLIAVRTYFIACLFGRQYLDPTKNYGQEHEIDIYIPPFTLLQFVFYVGWMKVAEVLLNPLGVDDDDFEMNHLCDMALTQSLAIVDGDADAVPELVHDIWWDKHGDDVQMPYTVGSEGLMNMPQVNSVEAETIRLTEKEEEVIVPEPDGETEILRRRLQSVKTSKRRPILELDVNTFDEEAKGNRQLTNLERVQKFGSSIATLSVGSFFGTGANSLASASTDTINKV